QKSRWARRRTTPFPSRSRWGGFPQLDPVWVGTAGEKPRLLACSPHPDFAGIVVLPSLYQMGRYSHHLAHDSHHSGHFLESSLHQMMRIRSQSAEPSKGLAKIKISGNPRG